MRCIICYRKPSGTVGYIEFGVTGEHDPVIADKRDELGDDVEIIALRIW